MPNMSIKNPSKHYYKNRCLELEHKIVEMEKVFIPFPTKIFIWAAGNKIDSSEMDFTSMPMERNIKVNS